MKDLGNIEVINKSNYIIIKNLNKKLVGKKIWY